MSVRLVLHSRYLILVGTDVNSRCVCLQRIQHFSWIVLVHNRNICKKRVNLRQLSENDQQKNGFFRKINVHFKLNYINKKKLNSNIHIMGDWWKVLGGQSNFKLIAHWLFEIDVWRKRHISPEGRPKFVDVQWKTRTGFTEKVQCHRYGFPTMIHYYYKCVFILSKYLLILQYHLTQTKSTGLFYFAHYTQSF